MAAFNMMVHRLVTRSLSIKDYMDELNYIQKTAETNGYKHQDIDKLVHKHSKKKKKEWKS